MARENVHGMHDIGIKKRLELEKEHGASFVSLQLQQLAALSPG